MNRHKLILIALALAITSPVGDAKTKRSAIAKSDFKHQQPCPSTGRAHGACPGWVIDHIVPLKRGGADHPHNMQWQTTLDAKDKDRWE